MLFSKIGGYNSRTAYFMCLIIGSLAVAAAIPVPFVSGIVPVFTFIWAIFFFGAMVISPLTGMMLNTLSDPINVRSSERKCLFDNLRLANHMITFEILLRL